MLKILENRKTCISHMTQQILDGNHRLLVISGFQGYKCSMKLEFYRGFTKTCCILMTLNLFNVNRE